MRRCCVRGHSSGVFCHEAPVNVCVFLKYELFIHYDVPQSAPYENEKYVFAGRQVVRNRYQVVTCLFDVDCL